MSPSPESIALPQAPELASAVQVPATTTVVAQPRRGWLRKLFGTLLALLLIAAAAIGFVISRGGWYEAAAFEGPPPVQLSPKESARQAKLAEKMASLAPRGTYVFIDTYGNRVRVFKDGEPVRDAVCSTGSGTILKDPEKGREWVFDTPRGERKVQRKVKNPIWVKPDWAFIEEGYQPPSKDSPDRYDDFSLGDYGLYLGDGYIIHGTIFQTLLGQRVTHGCIRLGDADLEYVYKTVPLGAKVYLY